MTPVDSWKLRARLKESIRGFFRARDFLEIDTPIAVPCPGTEVHLGYFKTAWTDFKQRDHTLWLRSSPELHMKQALAEGAPRVFQLAPCFRNGGELSEWHHPEFTMLEWYETGIGFEPFIEETLALLRHTQDELRADLARLGRSPRPRLPDSVPSFTVVEAFREFAGLELVDQDPELGSKASDRGIISVQAEDDFETAFFKILIEKVEPGLTALGVAVLKDYPPSQSALAVVKDGVAKRFELYVDRVELCNGFEELLDPKTNRERIRQSSDRRRALGYEVPDEDHGFYEALERGLPPSCGNALGFDRWLALLAGEPSLDRIVPFRDAAPYAKARP